MTAVEVVDQRVQMLRQPMSADGLGKEERDALIVSMRKVDGIWVVVSRYGDDIWWTTGSPTNLTKGKTKLDYAELPEPFRAPVKALMYRFKRRGRRGQKPPAASTVASAFRYLTYFLHYAHDLGIRNLAGITPLACSSYMQSCMTMSKSRGGKGNGKAKPSSSRSGTPLAGLSPASIRFRLSVIELIYELSQFTDDPIPQHPWPETSANLIAGYKKARRATGNTTPLMSDEVFVGLFQTAWSIVKSAEKLLDFRDEIAKSCNRGGDGRANERTNRVLRELGWHGGVAALEMALTNVRTACYVVVASLSGCRNHELGFLRSNAIYSTINDKGERYWWMRSTSTKTDEGATEWMIPEAAVTAIRIMERWAAPYQVQLEAQIGALRSADPADPRIAEAQEHVGAIFIGISSGSKNEIRTLSVTQTNFTLKRFAKACGLTWNLASHQFRRKFANYAARSRFGDLRYLKEHFKHWSLDMTLGYGLNESQEMALYLDIEEESELLKEGVVSEWMSQAERLAGGYGANLVAWREREENITLFKDHAHMIRSIASSTTIRSNGHAWCTADDNLCEGNDIDPTRCGDGCSNAVVGSRHAPIYIGLFNELKTLENCDDIGEGGRARVARDLERCRSVLTTLGHDPLEPVPA